MPEKPLRRRADAEPSDLGLRALIVDDDENYRFFLASLVTRFGFSVATAGDGTQAIEILDVAPPFDLLLIDLEMPRVDGLATISSIRGNPRFADAFAVMVTGHDNVQTKIEALRLGYDDYISKSSSELEISAKLSAARRVILRQKKLDDAVRELYGLATRDELTGLYNRRFFFTEAERAVKSSEPVNLIVFDLDDFKRVNDTFGHLAGDRILRDIGTLFINHTRHGDVIARYGGDEFVMLVGESAPAEVEALEKRLVAAFSELAWTYGDVTFGISVTSGLACSSLIAQPTLAQLLGAADRDLYKNKWLRRNPDVDPTLYEYDNTRDAQVIEFLREVHSAVRRL
ncbi:MAG TPA: diguanylate cyclase [Thermoanaerobaculia bacterium]|jgi:two-component system chemotaxis response regulator CheY